MVNIKQRKYTTITIPSPLFERIQKLISNTGFSSVSDYVTYVLRETIADIGSKDKSKNSEIADKLRALGYLK
ncbi:MAG: ribbon-helix-helix domain-containing protein [Candidatus Micrarchaeaceae archaeon]